MTNNDNSRRPQSKNPRVVTVDFRKATPPPLDRMKFRRASEVEAKDATWLWWPYVPCGHITIIGGAGNIGKGLSSIDIAARVTRGDFVPLGEDRMPVGNVIIAEAEDDDAVTMKPRLIASNAVMDRVSFMSHDEFQAVDRQTIVRNGIKLIVLSPFISFTGIKSPNDEVQVREGLEKVLARVKDTNCALIGIMHPNKKMDAEAIDRFMGSVAWRNFIRSAMIVAAEPDEEHVVRVMHNKWNWGVKGDDMLFVKHHTNPEKPRSQYVAISWEGTDANIDESKQFALKSEEDPERGSAADWLVDYLERQKERRAKVSKVLDAAESASFKRNTVKAAKKSLGHRIKFIQNGVGRQNSEWQLTHDA